MLFAISMFAVLLSVPQQQGGASPTPDGASPSPSPGSEAFSGSGSGLARVVALSSQFLVQCNASRLEQAVALLEGRGEFGGGFAVSSQLIAVTLNESTAADFNRTAQAVLRGQVALSPYCLPRFFRKGAAEFGQELALNSDSTDGKGGNKTLFPRQLEAFAGLVGSSQGIPAYFQTYSQPNESVTLYASAKVSGDSLKEWFAQQPDERPREIRQFRSAAEISEVSSVLRAAVPITWRERRVGKDFLLSQFNATPEAFVVEKFEYTPVDAIGLENVSPAKLNSTAQALRKQPFVKTVLEQEGGLAVFVESNYSDEQGFGALASSLDSGALPVFPNSTATAEISLPTGFENASAALNSSFGSFAQFRLDGVVRLSEREQDSGREGLALPSEIPAQINPGPAAKPGTVLFFDFRVLAQGPLVLQAQARN